MKRFFVNFDLEVGKTYKIDGIEHNHIKNVMRMSIGDELILVCADEYDYYAKIVGMSKGDTTVNITNKEENVYNPVSNVTVFQALVKSDNMNLIIQKLTELGIRTFVPFESEFITSKDKFGKTSKFQEVSNQSIKQCKRSIPLKVEETVSFAKMVEKLKDYDIILFANECERQDKLNALDISKDKKVAIIIGSEGGFSENEISRLVTSGAKSISLGRRILRAETASIALSSVVMFLLGEWSYE
ncbi:MAG: 16S rRNA (uracil(1498)-N(3))-methyltransferase [Clostridiales bacterium]|nr:16S rRNA (uracil(1498)-N(3))-methyltransferase [Clostridiales bacterium]